MATSYTEIYDRALSKIREYMFLDMEDSQTYDVLSVFLKSAQTKFENICIESLSDVDETGYTSDLSNETIEILAWGITSYWFFTYVSDSDKLRNLLGTKDYTVFSPANLLNVTKETWKTIDLEFQDRVNRYSYLHGDLIRKEVRR